MIPLYIFDLDGTIADCEHRRHFIAGKKKDWRSFYESCGEDKPIMPVIKIAMTLDETCQELWLFSGRDDSVRVRTIDWLTEHGINTIFSKMRFRPASDFTPDEQLKLSWLKAMAPEDYRRLVAVFDDRKKVCEMWRANGVFVFQVAEGNY